MEESEHVHERQQLGTNDIFMYLLPHNDDYAHRAFPPAYYHVRIPITKSGITLKRKGQWRGTTHVRVHTHEHTYTHTSVFGGWLKYTLIYAVWKRFSMKVNQKFSFLL